MSESKVESKEEDRQIETKGSDEDLDQPIPSTPQKIGTKCKYSRQHFFESTARDSPLRRLERDIESDQETAYQ